MKKIILLLLFTVIASSASAQRVSSSSRSVNLSSQSESLTGGYQKGSRQRASSDVRGFGASIDMITSYGDDVTSLQYGVDLGTHFSEWIYWGVGPSFSFSMYNSQTYLNLGGYSRLRVSVPLEGSVRPFADLRVGYYQSLNFGTGGLGYDIGIGIRTRRALYTGIYFPLNSGNSGFSPAFLVGFNF